MNEPEEFAPQAVFVTLHCLIMKPPVMIAIMVALGVRIFFRRYPIAVLCQTSPDRHCPQAGSCRIVGPRGLHFGRPLGCRKEIGVEGAMLHFLGIMNRTHCRAIQGPRACELDL